MLPTSAPDCVITLLFQVGDQILSVDETSLVGVTQEEAGAILRSANDRACLVIARNINKAPDEV